LEISKEELKQIIVESLSEVKDKDKLTMTLDETCKLSGIGKNKLTELVYKENTDFPYFRVGTKVLVNREMLVNWLDKISKEGRTI
jgi:hypothetical protein